MVRKQSWHLFVCLRVSRCRAALFLYGLHGTLQRHLKREQLAGRLPQHKACHKLPQHGRALILLQRERDGNMVSKKQSVSLYSCLQTASSTMMMWLNYGTKGTEPGTFVSFTVLWGFRKQTSWKWCAECWLHSPQWVEQQWQVFSLKKNSGFLIYKMYNISIFRWSHCSSVKLWRISRARTRKHLVFYIDPEM